jgi:hypothetical protein
LKDRLEDNLIGKLILDIDPNKEELIQKLMKYRV